MQLKWFFFLIQVTGLFILFSWLDFSFVAKAESVSSVGTEGSIGFYGTYESESEPQPGPPDGIDSTLPNESTNKPGSGKLPQLGSIFANYWIWIGFIMMGVFLLRRRQTNFKVVKN